MFSKHSRAVSKGPLIPFHMQWR